MKNLSLLGEDGSNIAHAESERGSASYDVDIPANLALVGVYGQFGGDKTVQAIWGLGLIFFENEFEPDDPLVAALKEKIARLEMLINNQ